MNDVADRLEKALSAMTYGRDTVTERDRDSLVEIKNCLPTALRELRALRRLADAASALKAESLAVARTQVRGYGLQGKLAYLRKHAEDVDAALRAAKEER